MPVGSPLVNLQVKTSQETFRQFEDAYSTSECTTKGQFLEAIIESYLNPPKGKTVEVSKQEDQDTIQNLTNEIGRLKIEIDLKKEAMEGSDILCALKNEELERLKSLRANEPAAPILSENDILVNLSTLEHALLKIEAAYLKRKTGKDFTVSEILIKAYQECTITGGRNFPIKQWDKAEIKHVEERLKPAPNE